MRLGGAAAVAAVFVLAGCGGGQVETSPSSTSESLSAAPSTPPAVGLRAFCPKVEAALPKNLMVPSRRQLARMHSSMLALRATANVEAQNALDLLTNGIDKGRAAYVDNASEFGPGLEVHESFLAGLDAFAHRCKAAGSTALQ